MKKIISKSSFIFSLSSQTLGGFINNWWQNPQRALIFNYWKIINYITTIISSNNWNHRKKRELCLLLYHTSILWANFTYHLFHLSTYWCQCQWSRLWSRLHSLNTCPSLNGYMFLFVEVIYFEVFSYYVHEVYLSGLACRSEF